jgi:hypothetical protein
MSPEEISGILSRVRSGALSVEKAMEALRDLPFKELGFAKIDNHREIRLGYPEIIYCAGKSLEQIVSIFSYLLGQNRNILATRASEEVYKRVARLEPSAVYHTEARAITIERKKIKKTATYIAVVTAGTSDIPVAEEAAVTAESFGNRVSRHYDVGVAGIHRLFESLPEIRKARVVVAVAGMEGALASVLGGLIETPIIAVPTSVGYGASFEGLSALLTMLNSCAPGISVVNIDNGFGAGYLAGMINKLV